MCLVSFLRCSWTNTPRLSLFSVSSLLFEKKITHNLIHNNVVVKIQAIANYTIVLCVCVCHTSTHLWVPSVVGYRKLSSLSLFCVHCLRQYSPHTIHDCSCLCCYCYGCHLLWSPFLHHFPFSISFFQIVVIFLPFFPSSTPFEYRTQTKISIENVPKIECNSILNATQVVPICIFSYLMPSVWQVAYWIVGIFISQKPKQK